MELNLEPEGRNLFSGPHHGRATEIVPAFVEPLLETCWLATTSCFAVVYGFGR